ncbi:NERD domain-containing protein [Halostreptopolyspora alba]|uniref:NERD domain-containing protein n=1 Tax=Halostreptopolyspora alba TaxID=2487137 RepID=A0A3N0EHX2_9ACTN|nr:NERD domain-containing protein [Nocardiopsaceae bacterium YIM 96095]
METATSVEQDPQQSNDPDERRDAAHASFFVGSAASKGSDDSTAASRRKYAALVNSDVGRRWLLRGGLAALVGAAGGLLASDWRVGATFAAAAIVAFTVRAARRQSEVPRWRRPSAAQRRTEAQLKVMKRLGYQVLHARGIPGGNGQIDHFIVGRRGAFAIDSESWDKRLPLRNKLEKLYHGRFSKNERIDEALEEARTAERLISEELGRDIKVRAALAIYGPGMPWDSHRLRGVDIISGTKVRKWLRSGRDRLSEEEIEEIHQAAKRVLPPRY